jgi:hypothetical protein
VKQSLFDERTRGQANRVYELRAEALDELLGELVIGAEAERRGLSRDALIEAEAGAVTDDAVAAFFEGNRERMPADTAFEDVEATKPPPRSPRATASGSRCRSSTSG